MFRRLLLVVLVVAALAPVLRGDAAPPVLIEPGVTLGGIAVGGLSVPQAQAKLAPALARPVRVVDGRQRWVLKPAQYGGNVSLEETVQRALAAREGGAVAVVPNVDFAAVQSFVAGLSTQLARAAKNAQLLGLDGLRPKFGRAVTGRRVVRSLTTQRIVRALESARRPRVRVAVKPIEPAVTSANFGPVIVVRRGVNQLRLYDRTKLVRTFGVATGQAIYPTPLGTFHIVTMQRNPWWYPPTQDAWAQGLKPVPPGPGNPLGTRWMGLSAPGVGIHGTPDDTSIGYSASHGCIRMHIPDAEWLFEHVHVDTPVVIIDH